MAGEASNAGENLLLASASDPDAWDDSALIAAYDEAVARARELALGDSGGGKAARSGAFAGRQPQQSQRRQHQQRKEPQKQQKQQQQQPDEHLQWRVGDICRAIWSEDGVEYLARIISLTDPGRCLVEFVDYGNSEQQALVDLLPPEAEHARAAGAGSAIDNGGNAARSGETEGDASSSFQQQQQQHPPPPPPLPSLPGAASAAMDESTYNMLMSWYMSGYYTGYYVGRKAAQ